MVLSVGGSGVYKSSSGAGMDSASSGTQVQGDLIKPATYYMFRNFTLEAFLAEFKGDKN